ncbi:MAG: T9SS type A sorting domain-containing protein [Bacteroidota bacterium]
MINRYLFAACCLLSCLFLPSLSFAQNFEVDFDGIHFCGSNQYAAVIRIKAAAGNSFDPGSNSLFLNYNPLGLRFHSYSSSLLDTAGTCGANWDLHAYDHDSIQGAFSLVTTRLVDGASCQTIGDGSWYELGMVLFDVKDAALNPAIILDNGKTLMNQSTPNDGSNPVSLGAVSNLDQAGGLDPCSTFPVEWLGLEAEDRGGEVWLEWTVASEINNHRFIVERSYDGLLYSPVLKKNSLGNTDRQRSYQAVDTQPLEGVSFYRVKQVDFDGSFSYSSTVQLQLEESSIRVQAYPNPLFEGQNLSVDIRLGQEGSINVALFDLQGRRIHHEAHTLSSGRHQLALPVLNLVPGVYYVHVLGREWSRVQQISVR